MKHKITISLVLSALMLAGCASSSEGNAFQNLPSVEALEQDPKDTFAELIQDSDRVVIGRITGVEAAVDGDFQPDPDGAPDLVLVNIRATYTVQPKDGSAEIPVSVWTTVGSHVVEQALKDVVSGSFPQEDFIFPLMESQSYTVCVTADRVLCALNARDGAWYSPYDPEREVFPKDAIQPIGTLEEAIDVARQQQLIEPA